MAKLETLLCQGCGSPLGLDQLDKCPKCGSKNFVRGSIDPLTMDAQNTKETIEFFSKKIASNPKDTNSLFALGLFYLNVKNYSFSQENFLKAIKLSPMDPDVYYYYALSLMAGRSPISLDNKEADAIEEQIHTAVRMERKRKYLILLAFIEQGAYVSNGLQAKADPKQLISEAQMLVPEANDLAEIETHALPTDRQNKEFVEALRSGKNTAGYQKGLHFKSYNIGGYICPKCGEFSLSDNGDGTCTCDNCGNHISELPFSTMDSLVCLYPSSRDYDFKKDENGEYGDGYATLQNEHSRKEFFRLLYAPVKRPHESKPFYPILGAVKRFVKAFIVFFIVSIIMGEMTDSYIIEAHKNPVERAEEMKKCEKIMDDNFVIGYCCQADEGSYNGGWHYGKPDANVPVPYKLNAYTPTVLIIGIIAALLPWLFFIIKTLVEMRNTKKERDDIDASNKASDEQYERDTLAYQNRPTIQDYVFFCQQYLGKGQIPYGDVVQKTLDFLNVSEADVKGKILFLNYFDAFDENNGGTYTRPEDVLSDIYYIICIPDKTQLHIVKNCWHTPSNNLARPEVNTIFYKKLMRTEYDASNDRLDIIQDNGEVVHLELPSYERTNILEYQDKNPEDEVSFSITRMGNAMEFKRAIDNLIATYQ